MDTTWDDPSGGAREAKATPRAPALMIAWCADDPGRLGQLLRIPRRGTWSFGRGAASDGHARVELLQVRPGSITPCAPIDTRHLSRDQLALRMQGAGLHLMNRGRRRLLRDAQALPQCEVAPGQTLELEGQLVLLCVDRQEDAPPLRDFAWDRAGAFGEADADGVVGESDAAWLLRERLAFVAKRDAHVLVTGESGVGKELVARAIHAQSRRASGPFVSRNAATLPAGLIDAELFGNARNYPNPGMAERPGLIGEAHGGTLFLDEIGELPSEMQAHLLRVLDHGGEYQRLGEAGQRHADVRIVAATNRPTDELKLDLTARLALSVEVPGLAARVDDIPLLARHLLRRTAARDPELGARFFSGWDGAHGEPRLAPELVVALLGHGYRAHVRELEALLWQALATSDGGRIELTRAVEQLLAPREDASAVRDISAEALRESMARHGGVKEKVWRELGLANRYVLRRLLRKHGIDERD